MGPCSRVTRAAPLSATLGALLVLLACAGDPAGDRGDGPSAAEPVDAARLAALSERYPRLGEEPLPEPRPSDAAGRSASPWFPEEVIETVKGEATFYADRFEGRRTASGVPFRQNQMVAAHRAYPFGTILRVTNLRNGRSVRVRVVDRGPLGAAAHARNTILDLSRRAADELGYVAQGRTSVRVEVLEWGEGLAA